MGYYEHQEPLSVIELPVYIWVIMHAALIHAVQILSLFVRQPEQKLSILHHHANPI